MNVEITQCRRCSFQISLRMFLTIALVFGVAFGLHGPTMLDMEIRYFQPPSQPPPSPKPAKLTKATTVIVASPTLDPQLQKRFPELFSPDDLFSPDNRETDRVYEAERIDMMEREERFDREFELSPIRSP